jgi:tRNA(adenine34) deaminase
MSDVETMMGIALEEARMSALRGEAPVGAAIFRDGSLIAKSGNLREGMNDPLGHAELLVICEAANHLGTWKLTECTLVVTLEPCLMCAGAIVNSRIPRVVFGAFDTQAGACASLYNVLDDPRLNHRVDVLGGVSSIQCARLLADFFADRR